MSSECITINLNDQVTVVHATTINLLHLQSPPM